MCNDVLLFGKVNAVVDMEIAESTSIKFYSSLYIIFVVKKIQWVEIFTTYATSHL